MFVFSLLILLVGFADGAIYQDPVDSPYEDGLLPIATRVISPSINPLNPPPMHSKIFYPDEANMTESFKYGVFYFIPGLFGIVPTILYDDLLLSVAAHGYVTISTWPLVNGEGAGESNFTAEAHVANIDYLRENLPRNIRDLADFDYLGLGCHSAGCAPTLGLGRIDTSPYKATVNLEPVSLTIVGGADFVLPSVHLGAELANGSCSTPNFDYERFYNEFACPKTLMEAANAGHCDLLTDAGREDCSQFVCAASDETDLVLYRRFVQGLTAAFLNAHVQGQQDMLKFVTDPDNIIYPLKQHRQQLDCDA